MAQPMTPQEAKDITHMLNSTSINRKQAIKLLRACLGNINLAVAVLADPSLLCVAREAKSSPAHTPVPPEKESEPARKVPEQAGERTKKKKKKPAKTDAKPDMTTRAGDQGDIANMTAAKPPKDPPYSTSRMHARSPTMPFNLPRHPISKAAADYRNQVLASTEYRNQLLASLPPPTPAEQEERKRTAAIAKKLGSMIKPARRRRIEEEKNEICTAKRDKEREAAEEARLYSLRRRPGKGRNKTDGERHNPIPSAWDAYAEWEAALSPNVTIERRPRPKSFDPKDYSPMSSVFETVTEGSAATPVPPAPPVTQSKTDTQKNRKTKQPPLVGSQPESLELVPWSEKYALARADFFLANGFKRMPTQADLEKYMPRPQRKVKSRRKGPIPVPPPPHMPPGFQPLFEASAPATLENMEAIAGWLKDNGFSKVADLPDELPIPPLLSQSHQPAPVHPSSHTPATAENTQEDSADHASLSKSQKKALQRKQEKAKKKEKESAQQPLPPPPPGFENQPLGIIDPSCPPPPPPATQTQPPLPPPPPGFDTVSNGTSPPPTTHPKLFTDLSSLDLNFPKQTAWGIPLRDKADHPPPILPPLSPPKDLNDTFPAHAPPIEPPSKDTIDALPSTQDEVQEQGELPKKQKKRQKEKARRREKKEERETAAQSPPTPPRSKAMQNQRIVLQADDPIVVAALAEIEKRGGGKAFVSKIPISTQPAASPPQAKLRTVADAPSSPSIASALTDPGAFAGKGKQMEGVQRTDLPAVIYTITQSLFKPHPHTSQLAICRTLPTAQLVLQYLREVVAERPVHYVPSGSKKAIRTYRTILEWNEDEGRAFGFDAWVAEKNELVVKITVKEEGSEAVQKGVLVLEDEGVTREGVESVLRGGGRKLGDDGRWEG